MNLKERINKDFLKARKEKNKIAKEVLWQIISEIKNKEIEFRSQEKEITDNIIIKIIEKEIKQLNEEKTYLEKADRTGDSKYILNKILVIKQYLPKKIEKEKLKEIITKWKENNQVDDLLSRRGDLFKFLKNNFSWQYDWKEVNDIINNL